MARHGYKKIKERELSLLLSFLEAELRQIKAQGRN
jgi:hypothetical protein